VEPLVEFHAANLYMIVFEDAVATMHSGSDAQALDAGSEETIRYLESELRTAQENAQAMFEELESSNEELKSANEEFQSTNEELETSKEELESFNEELETVNGELNRKISELDHANSDLQNLLNSTQIATIFLDKESRIRSFTPAAGSVFRLIPGDRGRPITDLAAQLPEMDLARDIQEVLGTLSARERQLTGTGGRHYQMRILPYRTVRDVIEGVVLTFTDVTPLKQAEERAMDAKAYAESIVDTVHEPLLVLDANLRVQSASPTFYEIFQATAQQTINALVYELGNGQWDIPELRRLLGEILPARRTMEGFEVEHDFEGLGRRIMRLNGRQIRQQQPGHAELILLAIEDITEQTLAAVALRDSQERYRTLFDSCPIAIYSCESSGVIREFNPRAVELWGRAPKPGDTDERFCGSYKLYRPDGTFMPHNECPMAEVLAGTIPEARDMEVQIERPDGSRVTVLVNIRVLRNERGEITGAVNCFVDLTERKRADEALAQSREELSNRNEDLKHFSYAASHDLQEPLRMVTSYTQLLAREYQGKLDPMADQFIARAVEGALRMESLLTDLREFWSVNEKEIENLAPVDLNSVLEKALVALEIPIQETSAVVTHDLLSTVITEELPMVLLFQNLVGNAIKYHRPEAPPRIHLSTAKAGDRWKVTVKDNGIGIEAEFLKTIFAPFKRLQGREIPGTGIGLAICQKIVERYRGRIWVESAYGQGSAFHFTLPAQGGSV
jgi:signal transduction histidine kinase/flagellar motor protein MotB